MGRLQHYADKFFAAVLCVFTVIAFFCHSPYRVPVPHRDSGIFINIGANILQGKILYLQTWDNKQPLLYFLNALGLWLGQGSIWGVWALELVFLLAAVLIGYRLLRSNLPALGSFFVVMTSFLTIFPWIAANYSEEYSIFFQTAVLGVLFLEYLPNRKRSARPLAAFSIGILAGMSFGIKQTYIDVVIAVGLFLLFLAWVQRDRQIFATIALAALGFFLVNGLMILYFAINGALDAYIKSTFLFNSSVASLGLLELAHSFLERIEFLTATPFLLIISGVWLGSILILLYRGRWFFQALRDHPLTKWGFAAASVGFWLLLFVAQVRGSAPGMGVLEWLSVLGGSLSLIAALLLFLRKQNRPPTSVRKTTVREALSQIDWSKPAAPALLFLGLINLPIVVFYIALSGRDFYHYYISLYPSLFLLLGAGTAYLYPAAARASKTAIFNSILAALLILASFGPVLQIVAFLSNSGQTDARYEAAIYLNSVTTPDDTILVWGWEAVIYYLAERESPTRYEFQFPAYQEWAYQQTVTATLLDDIQRQPPAYIADLMDGGMPLIEGRSADTCVTGSRLEDPNLTAIVSFVCSNYAFDRSIGSYNIYRLR